MGSPSLTPGVGAPIKPHTEEIFIPNGERILYVDSLSSDLDCSNFMEMFRKFGDIKVIKFCETEDFAFWRVWIEFATHEDAINAFKSSSSEDLKCILTHKVPHNIDVDSFYPARVNQKTAEGTRNDRKPLPARWLIVLTKSDLCNLFHFRKHLRSLVGTLNNSDITRFGRNSFLVHAKSYRQGHMVSKLKNTIMIKEVKPHYSFSYAKGVVFSQDLYDLSDEELLEMCDDKVWKVFKVPRSKMIIFTFNTEGVPDYVYIDRERFRVRPYKHRPLQCFKCFGYGHSSKVCTRDQLCAACSLQKHEGECTNPILCINCKGKHNARHKECESLKIEMAAIEKAHAEHLSIGQAKRLLFPRPQYSDVVKHGKSNKKDQPRMPTSEPKLQLSPSELEVHSASPPSSKKAPLSPLEGTSQGFWEAPQASYIEASQADSLPDLSSQNETLIRAPHTAEVHTVEMVPLRDKRPRTPSSSPPISPHHSGAPKRRNSRSLEDLSSSAIKQRPNLSRPIHPISGKTNKKSNCK